MELEGRYTNPLGLQTQKQPSHRSASSMKHATMQYRSSTPSISQLNCYQVGAQIEGYIFPNIIKAGIGHSTETCLSLRLPRVQ